MASYIWFIRSSDHSVHTNILHLNGSGACLQQCLNTNTMLIKMYTQGLLTLFIHYTVHPFLDVHTLSLHLSHSSFIALLKVIYNVLSSLQSNQSPIQAMTNFQWNLWNLQIISNLLFIHLKSLGSSNITITETLKS